MNNNLTVDDAHARHNRIVALRNMAEHAFLTLGGELYEFEKHKDYATLGYASFNSYLADPDVDISPRTAYRLKSVYKKYILELALPPEAVASIGYTKLSMIAPQVTEDNAADWIAKAETLSRSDIIKELKDNDANYQEPPLVRLLDVMNITYSPYDTRINIDTLTDVKMIRQGLLITITGTLTPDAATRRGELALTSNRVSVTGRLVDENE